MTYHIHPIANIFPEMSQQEFSALADDIRSRGLIEPIWLYEDQVLDGRHRQLACARAGVLLYTREYRGEDPLGFVVAQNMLRRHLGEGQRAMAAARAATMRREDTLKQNATVAPIGATVTQSEAATMFGVARRSVQRARKVIDCAEPEIIAAADAGELPVSVAAKLADELPEVQRAVVADARTGIAPARAMRKMRDRAAETKKIAAARAAAEIDPKSLPAPRVIHGDFRTVLADLQNVDAIITDPPYGREYLPLLADLAALADRILKPDGVLAVLFGEAYLPDVYRLLGGGRPYRWTACYYAPGAGYVSHQANVQSNWKPLIIYGGGPRFSDVITSTADNKNNHAWGQDYDAFHTIITRLTKRGDTVVDPFCGGGTTLLAAAAQGRVSIGCDSDEEAVETTLRRLGGLAR